MAVRLLHITLCLTVLVVETYSSISWAREVLHLTKRQVGCQPNTEFKCTSGQCTDKLSVCDGRANCADGSDETLSQCSSISCPPSIFQCAYGACIDGYKRCNGEVDCADGSDEADPACPAARTTTSQITASVRLKCKDTEFKCESGQCINKLFVCDGRVNCADGSDETASQCSDVSPSSPSQEGGCLLPQQPDFGTYIAAVCEFNNKTVVCKQRSGVPVPQNWVLSFRCNEGYYIMDTKDENVYVVCVNGKWSPKFPGCRKMCSPLIPLSVDVRCFNGDDDIDCTKPMRPGTRAKGACKQFYTQIQPPQYTEITCRDSGHWSYKLFDCQPVCGKRNVQGVNIPLIIDGSATKYGEFPWHVGLYMMNDSNQWEQRCGGSLISPHIVLTAAHCVFSIQPKAQLPPEAVKVGLGKYYREWTHNEPYAVKADVREILIPSGYSGRENGYKKDIALLDLTRSVQVHAGIMPVCVDWKHEFIIKPGMLGTLAGWGRTRKGISSDILLYTDSPFIDNSHCIKEVPQVFQHYVTPEKFCAGFTNDTGAAFGDAGGGLTFVHGGLHYLYGILSTKVKQSKSFTIFTNVSDTELFIWLNYAKSKLDEAQLKIASDEFRCTSGEDIEIFSICNGNKECADGSDETEIACKQLNIKCPQSKFRCDYGACIEGNKRCNGQVDCADGSDEVAPACPGATASTPQVSLPWKCKDTEFRCTSGQCIDIFSVCDGRVNCSDGSDESVSQCSNISPPSLQQEGVCILPRPPDFGVYTVPVCEFGNKTAVCRQAPGTVVPQNWVLLLKCDEGYYFNETQDESYYIFCVNGKWHPKFPVCRKMCSPLVSLSVEVTCFTGEDDIDCTKPMRPGTRAKGECKPSYTQIWRPTYRDILCKQNGQWSYPLFYCQPVCGKRNTKGVNTPLISSGSAAKYGEFPWHVGLYMNASNKWEQRCGGSLISPHIVLTAAHCVYLEQKRRTLHPGEVKVGLGKYYREWTHDEPHAVKADVREILIPHRYIGQTASYTQDIALLDLKESVQIHARIMPVCLHWKHEIRITPGTLGTLPGWGITENGTYSDILLYADLPFVDYHNCIFKVPPIFQRYVTTDKFCAGYTNGTGAAKGDSGGGLTFVQDDLHYLYGIVSTKLQNLSSLITFTNISNVELSIWLNRAKQTFDEVHTET